MASSGEITILLAALKGGDAHAETRLISLVYDDLHALARRREVFCLCAEAKTAREFQTPLERAKHGPVLLRSDIANSGNACLRTAQ